MTNEELDAVIAGLQSMIADPWDKRTWEGAASKLGNGVAAIRTLRAQLVEAIELTNILKAKVEVFSEYEGDALNDLDAANARADLADAALAAQIEAEPVAWRWESCANSQGWNTRYGCSEPTPDPYIADITPLYAAQPHDRTALDRMLAEVRVQALRDAAGLCRDHEAGMQFRGNTGWALSKRAEGAGTHPGDAYAAAILALLDKEGA